MKIFIIVKWGSFLSLEHEFFLVESNLFNSSDFLKWYEFNRDSYDNKVIIEDTILLYIMDYIIWVPSFNPSTRTNCEGLNYHGVTLVKEQGCIILTKILKALIDLFSAGPETFVLTGEFTWTEDATIGNYEEIVIERDVLILQLEKLLGFAKKVKNESYFLLHYGI